MFEMVKELYGEIWMRRVARVKADGFSVGLLTSLMNVEGAKWAAGWLEVMWKDTRGEYRSIYIPGAQKRRKSENLLPTERAWGGTQTEVFGPSLIYSAPGGHSHLQQHKSSPSGQTTRLEHADLKS